MAKKVYDEDGLDMLGTNWSGDEATGGLPVSGRLVENYIKGIDEKATPTEEVVPGETKPPMSGAVAASQVGMVTDIDVRDSEDGSEYVMDVTQRDSEGGETKKEVRFPKYTDDDKVVINLSLTDASGAEVPQSQYLPLGSGFVVKYSATVGTAGGSSVDGYTDLKARVIVKRGSTVIPEFENAEFTGVTAGQEYTFDASPYLKDATSYTVQVEAEAAYGGGTLYRSAAARVTMVAMQMDTTFSVANGTAEGGYRNDVNIPFTVKGTTGEKNIYYRLNGGTPYTVGLSSGSGVQQKNVTVALTEMQEGANVVEAYALHESSGVKSRVHYITLLKAGDTVKEYVGMMFSHKADGFQSDYKNPILNAEQFTAWDFTYGAWNIESSISTVKIENAGAVVKEDRLVRGEAGGYGRTNVNAEPRSYTVSCGAAQVVLRVETSSHPDIEASLAPDAVCSFDAFGRSNTENNAASWVSGKYFMEFEDVLWSVNENGAGSGWHNDNLLLSNGASMTLTADGGYRPFNEADKPEGYSIREAGMTIEIEYSTANVTDTKAELITCLGTLGNGNRYGLVVTPEEAKFLTGVVTEAVDAGQIIRYEDSVGTKFEPGTNIRITYVFYPDVPTNEQRGLIGFYVNGEESAASKWLDKVNFDIKEQLRFTSHGSDLKVKSVRIYDKALTDDEVLNNYIVDRGHLEDTEDGQGVRSLDVENRVLSEGDTVSMEKLMGMMAKRKNSILMLIGTGSVGSEVPSESDTLNVMDALAQLNDKKANKLVREIRFYNGENRDLDFVLKNAYARIQGTSSVNYARKNLRFYFQKTAPGETVSLSYGEIDGNGQQSNPITTTGKKNLFKLRKNSVGAKLACPKCDFSDSSMTTNTGGAKFIHDGLKEMGLLTPAQRYAADHGLDEDIRSAIDGMPCDLFVAKSAADDLVYYGQYNCNNEKSDSYPIFGQDKTIGSETWGEGDTFNYLEAGEDGKKQYLPICFETLNNSNPCCLFHWVPSTEADHEDFMDNNFDGGLEFNHPKDTFWADGGGDADEEPNLKDHLGMNDVYDRMYKATDRMMSFVYRCIKETEAGRNMAYSTETHSFTGVDYEDDGDKFPTAKWKSDTFRKEAGKYFDLPYLIVYYLYVQFNLGVDQLAKNMLIRTWDGVKWYITYYDGDCQLGSDNKSFLTGKYNDNRQTKRDGAYVMQGHNSWLWNLILANCGDLMEEVMVSGVDGGTSFMSAFSIQKALDHFDKGQMERWCSRLYNKSGIFKYVYPFLNEMPVGADGAKQTYPQIYGLKGSLKAHRSYFISRRYDLKQVEYGYVSTLGAQFYQSTAALDAGYILKPVQYMLTIPYRVQLSTSNGVQADSGVVEADTLHTLQLKGAFGENDPLKIIGAAKIKELVWHEDAFAIGFNFGLFTSLVKLDMSVDSPSGLRNGSFMVSTASMLLLEEMNMRNNLLARNGDNGNFATLDLSRQARLRDLDLRGTGLVRVRLATGAPLTKFCLPDTIEELFLEHLTRLPESGLVLEDISNVTGYRFENCPGIDGFALLERLHAAKKSGTGKLERFRISIDTEDDGTLLEEYFNYGTYTAQGSQDNRHSGLRGRLQLTKYMEDADLMRYRERYPELEIVQVPYTTIVFDDDVPDDANITNTDNATGYRYGVDYSPSGHVRKVLNGRHRVMAKMVRKPTTHLVECFKQKVEVCNNDGKVVVYPLHDEDSNYYADGVNVKDCTPAVLTGEHGEVMMYEPHYWYKGVNDLMNYKKYALYNAERNMPPSPKCDIVTLDDIKAAEGGYTSGYSLLPRGAETPESAMKKETGFAVCKVNVKIKGYRQVRFPGVTGENNRGAAFVTADGRVCGEVILSALLSLSNDGMDTAAVIPPEAETLWFTIREEAQFDKVVLTESDKIEDTEPDWVEHKPYLCSVFGAAQYGTKLRSIVGLNQKILDKWFDACAASTASGWLMMDYAMHRDGANLFYAKYGRRDSQAQCGEGSPTHGYSNVNGVTAAMGMTDTVAPQDKMVNCMGYEDYICHRGNHLFGLEAYYIGPGGWRAHIRMTEPDGTKRMLYSPLYSGYIAGVAHGKYMDVVRTGSSYGTATTHYCDSMVLNQGGIANVNGEGKPALRAKDYITPNKTYGISHLDFASLPTGNSSSASVRLGFRGEIEFASSLDEFLKIKSVD